MLHPLSGCISEEAVGIQKFIREALWNQFVVGIATDNQGSMLKFFQAKIFPANLENKEICLVLCNVIFRQAFRWEVFAEQIVFRRLMDKTDCVVARIEIKKGFAAFRTILQVIQDLRWRDSIRIPSFRT